MLFTKEETFNDFALGLKFFKTTEQKKAMELYNQWLKTLPNSFSHNNEIVYIDKGFCQFHDGVNRLLDLPKKPVEDIVGYFNDNFNVDDYLNFSE